MQMIRAIAFLRWALLGALMVLTACSTTRPAPVIERTPMAPLPAVLAEKPAESQASKPAEPAPKIHVVQKGETLISIALQHGLDYKELAAWNNIENANVISVGRELVVSSPVLAAATGGVVATPLAIAGAPVATPLPLTGVPAPPAPIGAPVVPPTETKPGTTTGAAPASGLPSSTIKTEPRAVKVPYSEKALAELEAEAKSAGTISGTPSASVPVAPVAPVLPPTASSKGDDESIVWGWPAKGKLLGSYTEVSKGIDIGGAQGAPVLAAAGGKVMYSGTGIRGYGKLVIIKHNGTYLSAYAHNHNIVVKEGQDVKKGEKIAEMGSTDADQVKLHFEIRKQGKPVDPAKLLPPG
jgi:lipoprotein NlpD